MAKTRSDFIADGAAARRANQPRIADASSWQKQAFNEGWMAEQVVIVNAEEAAKNNVFSPFTPRVDWDKRERAITSRIARFAHINDLRKQASQERDFARFSRLTRKIAIILGRNAA